MKNVGFSSAVKQVNSIIKEIKPKYKYIFILGFSIGATIAWLCSDGDTKCNGIIGYYGSRIRDYLQVAPKCKTLLIFPSIEKSFDVNALIAALDRKTNISVYMLNGLHGLNNPFFQYITYESLKTIPVEYTYKHGSVV
jgi:dienelactone hydrolase